jgi:triphosphoribosyl-dephospho-CoA synthetase
MKKLKGLDEVHEIMATIYEEEKTLSPEQRIKNLREESDRFLRERNLNLKRVKRTTLKKMAV